MPHYPQSVFHLNKLNNSVIPLPKGESDKTSPPVSRCHVLFPVPNLHRNILSAFQKGQV